MAIFREGFGATQILQINGTVIAGILILVTVSSFNQTTPLMSGWGFKTVNQWVSLDLGVFALSSFFAVIALMMIANENRLIKIYHTSAGLMLGGFIYLIWIAILISAY